MRIRVHPCGAFIVSAFFKCAYYKSATSENFGNYYPIVLYKYTNFLTFNPDTMSPTKTLIKDSDNTAFLASHANSLTCKDKVNRIFMLATGDDPDTGYTSQVIRFGENGNVLSEYSSTLKIYRINYFGKIDGINRYLICQGKTDPESDTCIDYLYKYVHISGNHFVKDKSFVIKGIDGSYKTGNDDYYDRTTKYLYTTAFTRINNAQRPDGSTENTILNNKIYRYDLSSLSNISEGSSVYGTDLYQSDYGSTNGYTDWKYEIEGIGIKNGTIYAGTNTKVINGTSLLDYDSIYSLSTANL